MEMQKIIERAERNIRTALRDYGRYGYQDVLCDVSSDFIERLAEDSSRAKQDLRELFSKSPVWDEELDALVINGTRTHDPDYSRVRSLAKKILYTAMQKADETQYNDICWAIDFFSEPNAGEPEKQLWLTAINRIAPKAYAPGKKLSRVFKGLCDALGVTDDTAGSEFQRLYAQFADELTSKRIGFKLFVSINPAHFLTMSNPKGDSRGTTLTSCHSFNSTEYEYNNGCSGYARDSVSFIVFTVDDPSNPESLNNRKTTRQIFAYKPGNGLLLQSRMYNTSGGVYGAAADSKLYRDLVQREISMLEGAVNLWDTGNFVGKHDDCVEIGEGFGGYADWTYRDFDAHISIRKDHTDDWEPLTVGTWGLCASCGCETSHGAFCEDCEPGRSYCEWCENYVYGDLYYVRDSRGNEIGVCEDCRDEHFTYCDCCHEYYPNDDCTEVDGDWFCPDCLDEYCDRCEDCDEYFRRDDLTLVHDSMGYERFVCEDCRENYFLCPDCDEWFHEGSAWFVTCADGTEKHVCESCSENYEHCPSCEELIDSLKDDGTCPACGTVVEEKEEEIA